MLYKLNPMKNSGFLLLLFLFVFFAFTGAYAQSDDSKLYDPSRDAKADISKAVEQAKESGKHVLLQVGGNW